MKKKEEHVLVTMRNGKVELGCKHCGHGEQQDLPSSSTILQRIVKNYKERHSGCKPRK